MGVGFQVEEGLGDLTHSCYTLSRCPLRVCVYEPRVFRVQAGGPDTGWRDSSPIWGVQAGVEWLLFNDLKR